MAQVDEVKTAFRKCRGAFVSVSLLSGMSNLLLLTGSFFMLEVYDRVIPSRSVSTLIGLCAIAALLYVFQWLMDWVRGRILVRVGALLDNHLGERAYAVGLQLQMAGREGYTPPLRDLEAIRGFLQSGGPVAFFDLPWFPLYCVLCFAFHFWIGVTVLCGVVLLVIPTVLTNAITTPSVARINELTVRRAAVQDASQRNAEVLIASGMTEAMSRHGGAIHDALLAENQHAADVAGGFAALSKAMRMGLQSAVLAVGAYLVIQQEASAGIIIASSILSARALAPIEAVIGHWNGLLAARQGRLRLANALQSFPAEPPRTALPNPAKMFGAQQLGVAPPRAGRLIVSDVSFQLAAGQGLGVIGPSGTGKSTIARALVGIWKPTCLPSC